MFWVKAKESFQGVTRDGVYAVVDVQYTLSTPYFLIYDDLGRWHQYSSDLFAKEPY